jgi:hypothetical protein
VRIDVSDEQFEMRRVSSFEAFFAAALSQEQSRSLVRIFDTTRRE